MCVWCRATCRSCLCVLRDGRTPIRLFPLKSKETSRGNEVHSEGGREPVRALLGSEMDTTTGALLLTNSHVTPNHVHTDLEESQFVLYLQVGPFVDSNSEVSAVRAFAASALSFLLVIAAVLDADFAMQWSDAARSFCTVLSKQSIGSALRRAFAVSSRAWRRPIAANDQKYRKARRRNTAEHTTMSVDVVIGRGKQN